MRRSLLLLLCAAFALAACGGGTQPRAAGSPSPGASSSGPDASGGATPGATTSAGGASPQPSYTGPSASPAPTDEYPESAPGVKQAPLEVTMGFGCVVAGTAQRITIKSSPGLDLVWGTEYADGTDHSKWGGSGVTKIPPGGVYTSSWVVPPNAPIGQARTDVVVAGQIDGENAVAMKHLLWQVARRC